MTTPIQQEEKSEGMPKNKIRLIGAAIFLVGAVVGYYFIYLKWLAIKVLAPEVNYSIKAIIFVPMCIVFGLYYLLFTPSNNGAWKHLNSKEKRAIVIAFIITVIFSALLLIWFKSELSKYGYQ
jgi:hypothetical protein